MHFPVQTIHSFLCHWYFLNAADLSAFAWMNLDSGTRICLSMWFFQLSQRFFAQVNEVISVLRSKIVLLMADRNIILLQQC